MSPSVEESEQEGSIMGADGERTTAAMARMKKIANKIYDTTPGINECKSIRFSSPTNYPS